MSLITIYVDSKSDLLLGFARSYKLINSPSISEYLVDTDAIGRVLFYSSNSIFYVIVFNKIGFVDCKFCSCNNKPLMDKLRDFFVEEDVLVYEDYGY